MKEISGTRFVEVDGNALQYNHAKVLSFWLNRDKFTLFRKKISVDNYIAIQNDRRQFYPFAMCRESNSDNYIDRTPTAYYLTLDEAKAIVAYMEQTTNSKEDT